MFRLKKLTDYAILTMTCVARSPEQPWHAARDLATETHLPLPTVSKILKELSDHGLLVSHRGPKGGYTLARNPHEISVAERSEEHTSELQSLAYLVCRLLLEKKKKNNTVAL